MNLERIKEIAAEILKVGKSKIWIDPSKIKDIEKASTRADIKRFINKGYIKTKQDFLRWKDKQKEKKEKKHVRKGGKYSIVPRKRRWINKIRAIRKLLKILKEKKVIDNKTYRKLYRMAKGGYFKSRRHVLMYLGIEK